MQLLHKKSPAVSVVSLTATRGRIFSMASARGEEVSKTRITSSFHHGITYTSYEGNSFGVKFQNSGVRVLIDPWLEGDLTFADQTWLYRGKKRVINTAKGVKVDIAQIAAETDVVVLTQYLDDHTHIPTLRKFPRNILIVANPGAAEVIAPLGFSNVMVIDHGESVAVADGRLTVTATAGALVGPPWSKRQNGVLFREVASKTDGTSASLYYEPHCDFDEGSVSKLGRVDIVVSPVKTTLLGVGEIAYPLVMGDMNLQKLLGILKPKVLVPLLNAEIDQEGPLKELILEKGSFEEVKAKLAATGSGVSTRFEFPAPPGESLSIAL